MPIGQVEGRALLKHRYAKQLNQRLRTSDPPGLSPSPSTTTTGDSASSSAFAASASTAALPAGAAGGR